MKNINLTELAKNISGAGITEIEAVDTRDIAIIGIAARLPQAENLNEFWDKLKIGRNFITDLPQGRKSEADAYLRFTKKGSPGGNYKKGAYLDRLDGFDCRFFNLSPREASLMDPNQRLFLEIAWSAIEDAGYGNDQLIGSKSGVYCGFVSDLAYQRLIAEVEPGAIGISIPGNMAAVIPGRVSYILDLKGPSILIDTACSSSLVAIHTACSAIRNGECDLAIAGSVKLSLLPLEDENMLGIESKSYLCRAFDDNADGVCMGEGVIAVVLKPLDKAAKDQDHIYAVIKGSAVNQDGRTIGITAPNALSQAEVLENAWRDAGIDPETITYIETHGTGTKLGDPIEIDGISRAFRKYSDKKQFCAIGSVKTNLGHLDSAAGMAGLLKAILALKHKQIPPSINFEAPNRNIDFHNSPVYVNNQLLEWRSDDSPRRCGVSAFGLSGTNCHIILEEAPKPLISPGAERLWQAFALSAKTKDGLKQLVQEYRELLAREPGIRLGDLCYTANSGRGHYTYRLAIIAGNLPDLTQKLDWLGENKIAAAEANGIYYHEADQASEKSRELTETEIIRLTGIAGDKAAEFGSNPNLKALLHDICALYVKGAAIDWRVLSGSGSCQKISLPTYPFERRRCWLEIPAPLHPKPVIPEGENQLSGKIGDPGDETGAPMKAGVVELQGRVDGDYSALEGQVAQAFGEILGFHEINLNDSFYELGGDSILAMKIVNLINSRENHKLEVSALLKYQTIRELAAFIEQQRSGGSIAAENTQPPGAITITPLEEHPYYALSAAQTRIFLVEQLDNTGISYNISLALILEGALERHRLEKAFQTIVKRHEALRTSFELIADRPVQIIHPELDFQISYCEAPEGELDRILKGFIRKFDLSQAPLLRIGLVKLSPGKHALLFDIHHIISDAFTLTIITREFIDLYNGEELAPLRIQYKDYAAWHNQLLSSMASHADAWHNRMMNSAALEKQEKYWLDQFQGEIPVLNLPTDYPRTGMMGYEGSSIDFELDPALVADLTSLSQQNGATLFMTLLAAYNVLLAKCSGQEDIVVGAPILGRGNAELLKMIGVFINLIALRNHPASGLVFVDFLKQVRENSFQAFDNQDYQFESLLEKLNIPRDLTRSPLFDTMINWLIDQKTGIAKSAGNLKIYPHNLELNTAKFDLSLYLSYVDERLCISCVYRTALFKRSTVQYLMDEFCRLLREIVQDPQRRLKDYPIFPRPRTILLESAIQPGLSFNFFEKPEIEQSIMARFEKQVPKYAGKIAIASGSMQLTYRELNCFANRIARAVMKIVGSSNCHVALLLGHEAPMIAAILGVLKTGNPYVPLDPSYPLERLKFMLADSQAVLIITDHDKYELAKELATKNHAANSLPVINVENLPKEGDETNPNLEVAPDRLAYILYTSGSTGNPKGVMQNHRNVLYYIRQYTNFLRLTSQDRLTMFSSYSHDAGVVDIFSAVLNGATLCPYNLKADNDFNRLKNWLNDQQITIYHSVPTVFEYFTHSLTEANELPTVRAVVLGGEAVYQKHLQAYRTHFSAECRFVNLLGSSEASITMMNLIDKNSEITGNTVPAGYPGEEMDLDLVNEKGETAGIFGMGEIVYRSKYLALGYWNQPEKTLEVFPEAVDGTGRLYRSGDLGRFLIDGKMEFIGRNDFQVKIRGYRVELSEVEALLDQAPGIAGSLVAAFRDENGEIYLTAYYISKQSAQPDPGDLKNILRRTLPDFMIPVYFMELDEFPRTPNGKIERRSLPRPDLKLPGTSSYEAPRNETEKSLLGIWQEILGVQGIGINDRFFEIGGHSLKAVVIASRIMKTFGTKLAIREFFERQTIKELAELIGQREKVTYQAIEVIPEGAGPVKTYPVSAAQKRLYTLYQLVGENLAYNMPTAMLIEGEFEPSQLDRVFAEIIQRHSAFRTFFEMEGEEPVQRIQDRVDFKIEDWNLVDGADEGEDSNPRVQSIVRRFIRPFDIQQAPLLRVGLVELSEAGASTNEHARMRHLLLFDMSHLISDGVSVAILCREFIELYHGRSLPPLRIQYKDYSSWHNRLLKSELMKAQQKYWLDLFADPITVLNLPADFPRPPVQSYEGGGVTCRIGKEILDQINGLAAQAGATLYMLMLATFNVLLFRYSGQDDLIIGSPVAGRNHPDLEGVIGMFVNTLALRNRLSGEQTFREFLATVKDNCLKAFENQDYQFEDLVENLDLQRDLSRNPLFDVMFVLQNMEMPRAEIGNLKFSSYEYEHKVSKFDLTFTVNESETGLTIQIEYCAKLFKQETIERMAAHFTNIVHAAVKNPKLRLGEIEMMSAEEKSRILLDFNHTRADYPKVKSIQGLFEEQAERTPDNIAIIFDDQPLTYRELNQKANSLARVLRDKGVQSNCIVGIMIERSLELMIGILGILKAGGAYLPLDPKYPIERVKYILEDSHVTIMLSHHGLVTDNDDIGIHQIDVSDPALYQGDGFHIDFSSDGRLAYRLAYVIYTSGSTGRPKGVMIEHQAVHNFIQGITRKIDFQPGKAILGITTISFDIFGLETLAALLNGLKIVFASEKEQYEPQLLKGLLNKHKIDLMQTTPSRMRLLLTDADTDDLSWLKNLDAIMIGGETFPERLFHQLRTLTTAKIYNMYGPTETTIWSTVKELTNDQPISIGAPISNTQIYIINPYQQIQPIGIIGELCIAGDGLARGYLNRPELTAEKFVVGASPPWEGIRESPQQRIYRTGDLARWLPDGNIEFFGRSDYQVKIRGFRIELGEIEIQLCNHERIKEAVVVASEAGDIGFAGEANVARENTGAAKEDAAGNNYLCAYVVGEGEILLSELRTFLGAVLPDYMIPSYLIQLPEFPLTPNGKIDRKSLPHPDLKLARHSEYEAARSEIEAELVAIWEEVLKIEGVGVNDRFFEIGGHSLKAVVIASRIMKTFGTKLAVREFFERQTIKELAQLINQREKEIYQDIEVVPKGAGPVNSYPVSAAQKRLFALYQLMGENVAYNMPGAMLIEGEFDPSRLDRVFTEIIMRHDAFRTCFGIEGEAVVQWVQDRVDFKIEYWNLADGADEGEDSNPRLQSIVRRFIRPFDIQQAPLLRVGLVELPEMSSSAEARACTRHLLLFDMSHIISDGVSIAILCREFIELYHGHSLPPLRIQYKDFSSWHNRLLKSELMKQQQQYWLDLFADRIPALNLPTDFPRPPAPSFEGGRLTCRIGKEVSDQINGLAAQVGATLYMVMFAAFNVLLFRYSGQDDLIIGSPVAGRNHPDLDGVIGMFVNTLALRNRLSGEQTFLDFLAKVKDNCLKAYENQDYQFDDLVENLDLQRDLSRNPLFDVMFVLQNMEMPRAEIGNLKFSPWEFERQLSKFDLTFTVSESETGLTIQIEYCTKLFTKETINRMARHYLNSLREVLQNPGVQLGDIRIMSEAETKQILIDFNNTRAEYPKEKTIHRLFEEQVERTPENIALIYENRKLNYRELNIKVNQLAWKLKENGIAPDNIIGIMARRSPEMIIGMMAVLKSGAAYLPLDPDYPRDRISFMLEDSAAKVLLTQKDFMEWFTGWDKNLKVMDLEADDSYHQDIFNPESKNHPENLAYVIYTSGTTGKPKGAMIEHRNVVRLMFNDKMPFDFTSKDVWTMFHSFCFDFSVWEIYGALLYGGQLVIVPKITVQTPSEYLKLLKKHQVTILNQTPTAFYSLIYEELILPDSSLTLRYVIFGGEALKPLMLKEWRQKYPRTKLINMYGITETTVHVTYKEITAKEIEMNISNIGKPIPTLTTYIMDRGLRLLPVGIVGELCVGGDGVGRGYLNHPELTAERFTVREIHEFPLRRIERIYRSGDLAKFLPDGEMEYYGRIDHQVKIRGFRIETGEIEAKLLSHPLIKEAIVIDREDNQRHKYLCAYLVALEQLTINEIREHITRDLPDYMIPSFFVQLEQMPLTSNGKLDRRALPEPGGDMATGRDYAPPTNAIEEKLVEIWEEVLNVDQVGILDNFFEIGGDSIKAIQVLARLQNSKLKLNMETFFQHQNIKELGGFVESMTSHPAEQGLITGEIGLTPIQGWFFENITADQHHFNQAVILYRSEGFNVNIIKEVFSNLIEHHDALRIAYQRDNNRIIQLDKGLEGELFTLETLDFSQGNEDAVIIEAEANRIQASIDLNSGPLVKLAVFKTRDGGHLLIVIHHLVIDGVSWRILLEDFTQGYLHLSENEAIKFSAKTDSYQTWSRKLSDYAQSMEPLAEISYWAELEKFKINPLPKERLIHEHKNQDNRSIQIYFSEQETEALLKQTGQAYNTGINDILLTALGLTVKEWTGDNRVLVSLEGHGRENILPDLDISRTIGWFTSIYPVILDLSYAADLSYQLRAVKEYLRHIPKRGIGYGILKYLVPKEKRGSLQFNLKPEIGFNYLGQVDQALEAGLFHASQLPIGRTMSPNQERLYSLDINGMVIGGKLVFDFKFNRNEYFEKTIRKLADNYRKFLLEVVNHCLESKEKKFTPTDLGDEDLSLEDLDTIMEIMNEKGGMKNG